MEDQKVGLEVELCFLREAKKDKEARLQAIKTEMNVRLQAARDEVAEINERILRISIELKSNEKAEVAKRIKQLGAEVAELEYSSKVLPEILEKFISYAAWSEKDGKNFELHKMIENASKLSPKSQEKFLNFNYPESIAPVQYKSALEGLLREQQKTGIGKILKAKIKRNKDPATK